MIEDNPNNVRPFSAFTLALAILLGLLPQPSKSAGPKAASGTVRPRVLIDINHATLEQLKSLPGVQDALAAKIVKNRPYASKTQLSSRGVVSAAEYRKIRPLIIAKQ
jgi:DNA uptake protein ComE-like DNA-binding protein